MPHASLQSGYQIICSEPVYENILCDPMSLGTRVRAHESAFKDVYFNKLICLKTKNGRNGGDQRLDTPVVVSQRTSGPSRPQKLYV